MSIDIATHDLPARTHRIRGGGGVELHVEETGSEHGRPVLFIHGFSQCGLAWRRQLHSDLEHDLRLVALDLRGHGRSERPRDSYADSGDWAGDVDAVMNALGLDGAVLCGWSYGGVVIGDYLATFGQDRIAGIGLVAAITGLGPSVEGYLGPDFLATLPGLFSADVESSAAAVQSFVRLCTQEEAAEDETYLTVGYNSVVPPHVREGLLRRTVTHEAAMRSLTVPALISHGLDDRVVLPAISDHHARVIRHATTSYYSGVGHAPSLEDGARFNRELLAFAGSL